MREFLSSMLLVTTSVILLIFIPCVIYFKKNKSWKIWLTLYVFLLIWILRAGVTFFGVLKTNEDLQTADLSWIEKLIDSFLHTLQSFSMDEDYTQYTLEGKRILESGGFGIWSMTYGFVVSVLNVSAPLLEGAILLDFLTRAFPSLKIFFHPFRHKIVFSELNEMSICLAEDIVKGNFKKIIALRRFEPQPLIIFTDAYIDEESEKSSELLGRAKAIKAVCVKTDLSEMSFAKAKSVTYLLMDNNFVDDVASFTYLMKDEKNQPKFKTKLKKFSLCITFDGVYSVKEKDFLKKIKYKIRAVDMVGCEEKLRDIEGNEVTAEDLTAHAVKYTVTNEKNQTKIIIDFDFSSRILDRTKPFSVSVINIKNFVNCDNENVEYQTEIPDPPTRIFLFVQEDHQAEIISKTYINSKDNAYKVVLRVIRDYKNAAINLMTEVPLFMPLLYKPVQQRKELHITIFGSGNIAREIFKTVYWCGQIPNVKLYVTVLSDKIELFKKELPIACPELLESCNESTPMLEVFPNDPSKPYNPPYIADLKLLKVKDVRDMSSLPNGVLEKTDYYVIALGSDELSVEMTNILSNTLQKLKLQNKCPKKSVIVPAVYNREIADAITVRRSDDVQNESFVIPFCVLDKRFSCENVFLFKSIDSAMATERLYNRSHQLDMQKDEYTYWANIARTIHAPYKLFGFGLLELVNGQETEITGVADEMYKLLDNVTISSIPEPEQSWIENRRWNAFMRAQGFSRPDKEEFEAYFELTKNHKNIPLKLHPCLVESCMEGTEKMPSSKNYDKRKYDHLDFVSIMVHHARMKIINAPEQDYYGKKLQDMEYKQWNRVKYDGTLKKLLTGDKADR